jgi:hypothetical protein
MNIRKLIEIDDKLKDPPTKEKMVREAKAFLTDWYKNRVIQDEYLDVAVQLDKPNWNIRGNLKGPIVEEVEDIGENITGRYNPENEKIQLQKDNYDKDTVLHEYDHYMNNFGKYSSRTDNDVIKNEIKSKERTKGLYNEQYDYFSEGVEVKARLMILRRAAGFKPNQHIEQEDLDNYFNNIPVENGTQTLPENIIDLQNMTDSDENLLKLLNYTADNTKQKNKDIFYAEEGGELYDTNYDNGDPENKKKAYKFFIEKGYSPQIALGIVGNLMQESYSNLDTSAKGDEGTAFGIAQCRNDRLDNLKKIRPDDYNTLTGQLEFIDWELNNTEKRAGSRLKEAKTIEDATLIFSKHYERPHKDYAHNDKRIGYARTLGETFGVRDTQERVRYEDYPEQKKDNIPNGQVTYANIDTEKKPKNLTEKDTREIFKKEQQNQVQQKESAFINHFKQQTQPQQEYQPQAQNLGFQYDIVDINKFEEGGKYKVPHNKIF